MRNIYLLIVLSALVASADEVHVYIEHKVDVDLKIHSAPVDLVVQGNVVENPPVDWGSIFAKVYNYADYAYEEVKEFFTPEYVEHLSFSPEKFDRMLQGAERSHQVMGNQRLISEVYIKDGDRDYVFAVIQVAALSEGTQHQWSDDPAVTIRMYEKVQDTWRLQRLAPEMWQSLLVQNDSAALRRLVDAGVVVIDLHKNVYPATVAPLQLAK